MARIFRDTITAIDIGTTKICVLVAHKSEQGAIEIIGMGKAPSHGLSKGVVVDITKTVHSIRAALRQAETMIGMPIESATIGISGGHIHSLNSHGVVPIARGEIRDHDVQAVLAAARAVPIPEGMHVLHVLAQYYMIDGRDRVIDPIGMHGIRLEVQAHIIMGAIASVQNLIKCCQMAGIAVTDIVLEQLASARAVLSEDERMLGVAMLDIGGGTSDLAIYHHGSIRHTMVLPVAGNHFTNDIAIGLRTTLADAERIKKEYGAVTLDVINHDDFIEVESAQGQARQLIHASDLVKILEPRAFEQLSLVHDEILRHKLEQSIKTGLVLTGGGSLLIGMKEMAHDIFKVPVRIGKPRVPVNASGELESPLYATGYGLLLHAVDSWKKTRMEDLEGTMLKRIVTRMKTWMIDFF